MNKFGCETNCERKRHTAEMMLPNVNWKMKNSNKYEIGFSTNEMTQAYCHAIYGLKLTMNFTIYFQDYEIVKKIDS